MTLREVLLRKKSKLYLTAGTGKTGPHIVMTLNRNLESLGYTLAPAVLEQLTMRSQDDVVALYHEIVPVLKEMAGAHVRHHPMYPNFPTQVMEMADAELYANAMMHYLGDWVSLFTDDRIRLMPESDIEERTPLLDDVKLKTITLGDDDEAMDVFTKIVSARTSISEYDRSVIDWFVQEYKENIIPFIPEDIPYKEQLCFVVASLLEHTNAASSIADRVGNATDVLRIAAALSGGDISLATTTRFKRWKRKERRVLLGYLEGCNNLEEDIARHIGRWVVLFHGLHVGDYASRYPRAFAAAKAARGAEKISTFNGKVEKAISAGDIQDAALLLVSRPGEFARRLDKVLREASEPDIIADMFLSVAEKVATPVLLQVHQHFNTRNSSARRVVFPKGVLAKMQMLDPVPGEIDESLCGRVVDGIRETLVDRFSALPKFPGPCYLDPVLEQIIVPFSQRSASTSLRTLTRGSKLPLPKCNTIRLFIHWMENAGLDGHYSDRIDVDLSCLFLDRNFSDIGTVSYYQMRALGTYHSGDLTSAPQPEGATEFIDINMDELFRSGKSGKTGKDIRYVAMCLNSYSLQNFSEISPCFAGWMAREYPNSGEIFSPITVVDRFDVTATSKICVPVLFDIIKWKAIWVDMSLKSLPNFVNNVHNNKANLTQISRAMSDLNRTTLADLLRMHIAARGVLVDDPSDAEVIFDMDFATDVDRISAEYL